MVSVSIYIILITDLQKAGTAICALLIDTWKNGVDCPMVQSGRHRLGTRMVFFEPFHSLLCNTVCLTYQQCILITEAPELYYGRQQKSEYSHSLVG
jgi:hypothetical protein